MTLIRWKPTRDLVAWPSSLWNMQREINRMFDDVVGGGMQDDASTGLSMWTPPVDIVEHETEYEVKVELPGVRKDDVKITLESSVLTIRGEKKQEKEIKEDNLHRIERSYGSFQRSFTLPTTVKSDKIEANYRDGVLTVTLPKAEEAKPKQITVSVK